MLSLNSVSGGGNVFLLRSLKMMACVLAVLMPIFQLVHQCSMLWSAFWSRDVMQRSVLLWATMAVSSAKRWR